MRVGGVVETYEERIRRLNANLRVCNTITRGWQGEDDVVAAVREWRKEIEEEIIATEEEREA